MTLAELMNKLCDLGLKEFDPAKKFNSEPALARVKGSERKPVESKPREIKSAKTKQVATRKRRHISASLKREVWFKSEGKCSRCGTQRALQIEHIRPVAWGGDNTPDNLTLLCRPCNQRAAIEKLGLRKMDPYLNRRFR
jgi:5-methylcytosine-specific restriction endonuclease McrA